MLMCLEKNCTCFQHRVLDCLKKGLNEEAQILLEKLGNPCEWIDTSKLTLLHYSAKYGNAEMTQYFIDKKCNVDAQDNHRITPIMLAIASTDVKTVEILLKNNADIYITDSNGTNAIERAFCRRLYYTALCPLKQNSYLILEILVDKINNDFSKGTMKNILLNANDLVKMAFVVFGGVEITRFVLENCYSIDFHEPIYSLTALHSAILLARLENAKILIEHGANVSTFSTRCDCSPLRDYVINSENLDENSKVLKCLLKCSTDFDVPGRYDITDVVYLLLFGKKKTIKTVLLSGIDVDACLGEGGFLLGFIASNRHAEADVLNLFEELEIKFDVNQRWRSGWTALIETAFYRSSEKVEFLLRHGADVNAVGSDGCSALMHTNPNYERLESNPAKVIELLLQYGADAQSFFIGRSYLAHSFLYPGIKVIVAHWAMLEAEEQGSLTNLTLSTIESHERLKTYFDLCTQQLAKLEEVEVNGRVTLFKLLSEKEEKVVAYARNEEFLSEFSSAITNTHLEPYYLNILQRKVSKGSGAATFQEKVALRIEALTGLHADIYHTIVFKIIGYLEECDLRNLCEI